MPQPEDEIDRRKSSPYGTSPGHDQPEIKKRRFKNASEQNLVGRASFQPQTKLSQGHPMNSNPRERFTTQEQVTMDRFMMGEENQTGQDYRTPAII